MKNIKYIFLFLFCAIIIVIYINTNCNLDYCDNKRVKNGKYCIEHTCEEEGCNSEKGAGNQHFCDYHLFQHITNFEEENKIILSDSQLDICSELLEDYISKLKEEQSNIAKITILSDIPETSSLYVEYRIAVTYDNENIKFATLYIIKIDDQFKIDKLLFD